MTDAESQVLAQRIGRAGVITLNRPKALNALTHEMVDAITAALRAWAQDPAVAQVVVRQSGEKAFCAGGDIRQQHDLGRAGDFDRMMGFYRDEYRMNRLIKRYPKPYLALIDGIVMGGGVGISVHGTYRVGTDKLIFAMPEVGIGFFPDVGGTYFLPRLPGETGLYLALTGERLRIPDALWAGIVTHYVPGAELPRLFEALTEAEDVEATLQRFAQEPGPAPLAERAAAIDRLFAGKTLETVLASIHAAAEAGDAFAKKVAQTIDARSPTALAVTFRQVREGAHLSFEDCMRLEWRLAERMSRGHDFYEGVRAVILDKDNKPRWEPPSLAALGPDAVEAHFAPLPGRELEFA